ncbi:MAG: ComEC/Rec2 family competence protein, partial [Acidimicrobiia bacterium]
MNRAAPEEANWVEWRGPPIVVSLGTGDVGPIEVGERLAVSGRFTRSPGFAGGSPFAGRLVAIRAVPVSDTGSPFLRVGNSLRRRAVEQLRDRGPDAALLSGFVVGDINQLPQADVEALRLAGLSHFVAVSGSNVAGFLLLWFILLGPLGVGSRRRGVLGVVAIVVYAIATRWEPSVVRASLMAGVILGGRAVGVPVDTWMALGWSGTLAMLVAPGLAVSVGFQLSVLATVGIMVGSDLLSPNLPRWLRRSLGPTLAAQAAVTPLLLAMFGSVPLISPLANLVAAPLVSIATLLGTLGVALGLEPIVNSSLAVASLILNLAHFAAGFPQISVVGLLLVIGAALLARSARIRPVLAVGAAIVLVWTSLVARPVNPPAVIFLDVGQGDSSLIVAVEGRAILVDAGPDPTGLLNALRHYRINQIDLLVLTHPHEDHVGGLEGVVGRVRIARVWVWGNNHKTESWNRVHQALLARRVPIEVPPVGTVEGYGGVELE